MSYDFSHCYDKTPDQKQHKKGGLVLAHDFRTYSLSGWEGHGSEDTGGRSHCVLSHKADKWKLALGTCSPLRSIQGSSLEMWGAFWILK